MKQILLAISILFSLNLSAQVFSGKSVNGTPFDSTGNVVVSTGSSGWALTGNTGITSATQFIGTNDSAKVRIKTNNLDAIVIDSNQNVGIKAAPIAGVSLYAYNQSPTGSQGSYAITDIADFGNSSGKFKIYSDSYNAIHLASTATDATVYIDKLGYSNLAKIAPVGTGVNGDGVVETHYAQYNYHNMFTLDVRNALTTGRAFRILTNAGATENFAVDGYANVYARGKYQYYYNPTMSTADSLVLPDKKYVDSLHALSVTQTLQEVTNSGATTNVPIIDSSAVQVTPTFMSNFAISMNYTGNGIDGKGAIDFRDWSTGNGNIVELSPVDNLVSSMHVLRLPAGLITGDNDTLATQRFVRDIVGSIHIDTIPLLSFGFGSALAGDTAAASLGAIYGSTRNLGTDTLNITKMVIDLQGTSPNVTVAIYWNDSLGVTGPGATMLVNAGSAATDTYTGTTVTTFDNAKIPPGVVVWCELTSITTKPTYVSATLIGSKIHN